MNINTINFNLIEEIKKRISGPIIDSLAKILPMGKDAIYRRVRGEVLFSYADAVLISQKLSISLDQINLNTADYVTFRINPHPINLDINDSYIFSNVIFNAFTANAEGVVPKLHFAGTGIPLTVILNHKHLSKFRIFKWLHDNRQMEDQLNKFSQTVISDDLQMKLVAFQNQLCQIKSIYILSETMFENYLREVAHFVDIELVDQSEADNIKLDLHALINEFETIVSAGKFNNGEEVSIYLSSISIDPTFGYMENGNSEFALVRISGMNYGFSENYQIIKASKASFENSKEYSTLITKSGAAKRIAFFNKQRRLIDNFGLNNNG